MSDLSEISDDESGTQVQNQRKEKGIKRSRELPNFDSEEDDDLQHDGLADSISSTDDIQPPPFRQSSSGNTRHLSVNQVLNQIDDEDNDDDHDDSHSTSMETAPYTCSSTPVRQTITAAVHRGETPPVQSARRCQEPVARMLNRPASSSHSATTPSTRHSVNTSTPSPNMTKGTSSTQQLLLKVLENQQEILKRIKTIEMEVKIKKTTEKPVDIKVPNGMKNAVKVGYKEGVRQGLKWQFEGKRVNDADNREMSDYIITFVKGWNSAYSDQTVINCALSRYFLTKRQEETAIKKDRLEGEKKRRAAYERKKEKAKRRLCALEKMELGLNKKAKIMEVMKPAYMSSDEENGQDGFITHQPSWQSSKFKDYKSKLDNAYKNVCSKASLRLLQKRTIGNQSQKDVPQLAENCQWIVRDLEPQNIGNQ